MGSFAGLRERVEVSKLVDEFQHGASIFELKNSVPEGFHDYAADQLQEKGLADDGISLLEMVEQGNDLSASAEAYRDLGLRDVADAIAATIPESN